MSGIRCYNVADEKELYNVIKECVEEGAYGLVKMHGVKVAINPHQKPYYDTKQRISDILVDAMDVIDYKLLTKYAVAVLNDDVQTQNEIKEALSDKSEILNKMSKENIKKLGFNSGYIKDNIAEMHVESQAKEIYLLRDMNGTLVLTGPNVRMHAVLDAYEDNAMVEGLEDVLKERQLSVDKKAEQAPKK